MDNSYLTFNTLEECQSALDEINAVMREFALQKGLFVIDGVIVGECNGKPAFDAAGTTTWDIPKELDGKFYLATPSSDIMSEVSFTPVYGEYSPLVSEEV